MDRLSRISGNLVRRDTAVDYSVVITRAEVVNDGGTVNNRGHLPGREAMLRRPTVAEPAPRNEGIAIGTQAEVGIMKAPTAVITKAVSRPVMALWGKRCPAAIVVIVAPGDPRRRPNLVRPPTPALRRVIEPAPIMKRHSPRIV